jgi:hypothetical protein
LEASGGHSPEGPPEDSDDDAPSELLAPVLEEWREVMVTHVLQRLDPTDCTMLARVGKLWLAVVVANNLPRAGKGGAGRLKLEDFVGSVERLAWAKDNGCKWNKLTCAYIARGGHLGVLQWAREHGCPWSSTTCERAAEGGHLEVLTWAREHDCPWGTQTCDSAAGGGHLEVLKWAREHHCPWDEATGMFAAMHGHLDVLRWARQHNCEWGQRTCSCAAYGSQLEVLQWLREHGCPWDASECARDADRRGHVEVARWVRAQAP